MLKFYPKLSVDKVVLDFLSFSGFNLFSKSPLPYDVPLVIGKGSLQLNNHRFIPVQIQRFAKFNHVSADYIIPTFGITN